MTCTAFSDDVEPVVRRRRRARMARRILPGQRSLGGCGRAMIGGEHGVIVRALQRDAGAKEHRIGVSGVRRCGSVWLCPDCAAAVSERRALELEKAASKWTEAGHSVALLTLTFPHKLSDVLYETLERCKVAMTALRGSRGWKEGVRELGVLGTVRAMEVTWGRPAGWHPHFHLLLFVWGKASAAELEAFKEAVFSVWLSACLGAGLEAPSRRFGVDLVTGVTVGERLAAYLAKFGDEPKVKRGVERELAKSHTKRARGDGDRYHPFALLDAFEATGDLEFSRRFLEYALSFKGARQLVWSRGLRADLAEFAGFSVDERSDAEIAESHYDEAPAVFEAEIAPSDWIAVVNAGLHADLLQSLAVEPTFTVLREVIDAAHAVMHHRHLNQLKRMNAALLAADIIPRPHSAA